MIELYHEASGVILSRKGFRRLFALSLFVGGALLPALSRASIFDEPPSKKPVNKSGWGAETDPNRLCSRIMTPVGTSDNGAQNYFAFPHDGTTPYSFTSLPSGVVNVAPTVSVTFDQLRFPVAPHTMQFLSDIVTRATKTNAAGPRDDAALVRVIIDALNYLKNPKPNERDPKLTANDVALVPTSSLDKLGFSERIRVEQALDMVEVHEFSPPVIIKAQMRAGFQGIAHEMRQVLETSINDYYRRDARRAAQIAAESEENTTKVSTDEVLTAVADGLFFALVHNLELKRLSEAERIFLAAMERMGYRSNTQLLAVINAVKFQ